MQTTRTRTGLLLLGAVFNLGALRAQAQRSPSTPQDVSLAFTYTTAHSNRIDGTTFWPEGGSFNLNARFYRGFGMAASATGLRSGGDSVHEPLDLVTIAFGPSYTIGVGRHLSLFGEALLGEAHGFHSLFSTGSGPLPSLVYGTTDSANALAFQTGGGVDLRLTRHLAVRPIEVEYLRTELPNGSANLQNNVRVAAGVVLRFAHGS